eukprot:CAMPEP_0172493172 /NCGR_PEP_ID=MMETSP1066-20121228/24533_1 /TAXON_ID=671091 /ORGANISM="Coscinodiscus wailesii, Strain CCMP2513" /LENGTH=73 /DNA_ID=CAMNT_0013263195 /DNA_START=97 /DNA_END=318 /DNA_ORIENTATION=+
MPAPRNIRQRSEKFGKNISKRGNVPIGKAADHGEEPPLSKTMVAFFVFVVVGSSLVGILNLFKNTPNFADSEE